jgi:hypothetical protein
LSIIRRFSLINAVSRLVSDFLSIHPVAHLVNGRLPRRFPLLPMCSNPPNLILGRRTKTDKGQPWRNNMGREWRNEDASRLYLFPTAAYSSTHLVSQPISSMFRMNVYLRRHPTALLTAGTCRRDSLAGRPSSRAGASYFVYGIR